VHQESRIIGIDSKTVGQGGEEMDSSPLFVNGEESVKDSGIQVGLLDKVGTLVFHYDGRVKGFFLKSCCIRKT
jgi:hypothetical protein